MLFSDLVASYGVLLHTAFETAKISVPTVVDALLGRTDYERCNQRLHSWSKNLVEHARISLETHGLAHVTPGQSYVVMSNHQSDYDIPVLFQALGIPLRMVAKTELFRIPIFGQAMLDSGFIEIDRKNRRSAVASLQLAKDRIVRDRLSVWIAPEGTRSRTGELAPFKSGGFHLALDVGVPILPVTLRGTIDVLRAGDKVVHKGRRVDVDVHAPILATDFKRGQVKQLSDAVRERIASTL
jgi:1-acyl-sn-glycerol-3-phosphate acyltransferase